MAQILTVQGKRDEAITSLEEQVRGGKVTLPGRVLLARLYNVAGRQQEAEATFRAVLAERNDLPGVKNDLAYLLAQRGQDLDNALALAREARQGMPASPQVADTLGYVYLKKDLPGPAADQFREALGMIKSNHRAWPSIQYHLGLALKSLGQGPQAAEAFEKALAAAVEFPEAEATRKELEALRAQSAAPPKG
jgi:tetratricopeptide (TPR) repeat protein